MSTPTSRNHQPNGRARRLRPLAWAAIVITAIATVTVVETSVAERADAIEITDHPQLLFARTLTTNPFVGTTTRPADNEGLAYVPGDNSLWLADDNSHRLYEIDKDTGALKRVINQATLAAARRFGAADVAGTNTASDFEAMAYDAANDTLYAFSGKCCVAGIRAAAFRFVRDASGAFQVESFQPFTAPLNDFSGVGVAAGEIVVAMHDEFRKYHYEANTFGSAFQVAGVSGPVLGISDSTDGRDMWVVNRTTLYRVNLSTRTLYPAYTFGLTSRGVIDARSVAVANDQLYIGDGYEGYANNSPERFAVKVFDVVDLDAQYVPLQPARLMDTRPGMNTIDGHFAGVGERTTGSVTELTLLGRGGIPTNAGAVVLNVTVTEPQAPGFITVYPCDSLPNAANLNYVTGSTIPNAVVARVSTRGTTCLYTTAPTHLVVDVNGYHPAGGSFVPTVPSRLMDTREGMSTYDGAVAGIGLRPRGSVTELQVTGRPGVPAGANAVVLNVAVTEAQGPGFVTVFPCGSPLPNAANLNYGTGSTIPNAVIAKVGAGGRVCFFVSEATHLVVDLNGVYPAGSAYVPLSPGRLLDSRVGMTTIDNQFQEIGSRPAGWVTAITVTNRAGVAANAKAVVLNVAVTEAQAPGFVTVFPCGSALPNAANLNYVTGSTIPNAVVAKVGANGQVCFFTSAPTHLVVDVNGYHPPT